MGISKRIIDEQTIKSYRAALIELCRRQTKEILIISDFGKNQTIRSTAGGAIDVATTDGENSLLFPAASVTTALTSSPRTVKPVSRSSN